MKKNFKIVLGLTLGLAVAGVVAKPVSIEAKSKFVTVEQAGKKLVAAQERAYKNKKKASARFYYKVKTSKQDIAFIEKAFKEAAKIQYGKDVYHSGMTAVSDTYASWNSEKGSYFNKKKGIAYYCFTINGKSKAYRKDYRNAECERKLIKELKSFINGKGQFEKAWTTMAWFQARSCYDCGRNQKTTDYDLYKRQLRTDCDGLAAMYASYAYYAGVKKVGLVSYNGHMWNWIEVDGVKYYIDYQGCQLGGYSHTVKGIVESNTDDKYVYDRWYDLYYLDKWYRENVDSNAKKETNCKAIWDKMTSAQKKAFHVFEEVRTSWGDYQLTCESYAKSNFEPLKVFCDHSNGDHTVKQSKKWRYQIVDNKH